VAGGFAIDYLVLSDWSEFNSFAEIYQGDLAKIGVKLNIMSLPAATFYDQVNNRKYNGVYVAGGNGAVQPMWLYTFNGGLNPNSNNSGFKSERYSQLVTSATAEPDAAKRRVIYSQLNDLVLDEAFTMGVCTQAIRVAARAGVKDIGFQMHDAFNYAEAWLDS